MGPNNSWVNALLEAAQSGRCMPGSPVNVRPNDMGDLAVQIASSEKAGTTWARELLAICNGMKRTDSRRAISRDGKAEPFIFSLSRKN